MAEYNGYSIETICKQIDKEVGLATNTIEKGNAFCKWILKYLFEQSDDELDNLIAIGGKSDNSIDACMEENNTLRLIQTKYNTSHSWSGVTNFTSDMKRIIKNPNNYAGNNCLVSDVMELLSSYMESENKYVELYYITNVLFTREEKYKIAEEIKNFNEEFKSMGDKVTINILDIEGIKEHIDMDLDILPMKYRNKKARLILKNEFYSNITCVAEVELKEFIRFVNQNKEYLFYSNIRNYLRSTPVNKEIVKTFKTKPTDFWYFNNGITIVCDDFENVQGRNDFIDITTPQIVNGCQTANTLLNAYKELKDPILQNNLQGTILVKIIKDKNKHKKDEITQCTNRQNSVSGKDFFALDKFQKQMLKSFKDIGYFYEIQNKSSIAITKKELSSYKGIAELKYLFPKKFNNVLPVKQVIQTYAAGIHFLPGTAASRSGELMVYGKKWAHIFNENTPENPLLWVYPYAVMNYAKTYLDYSNSSSILYKRHSLMFFISAYFRTLIHIFRKINLISELEDVKPINISIENYTLLFNNSDLNKEVLEFVDNVVKRFLKDKYITKPIESKYGSLDYKNFMKSEVETNEKIKSTLDEFIVEELCDREDLITSVEKLYKIQ